MAENEEGTAGVPDESPDQQALAPGFKLVARVIIEAIQDPTGGVGLSIKSTTPDRLMMLDMINKIAGHLIQQLDKDRQGSQESPEGRVQGPTLWVPGMDDMPPRWGG